MRAAHRQPTIIATSAYLPSLEKARNPGKCDHGSSPLTAGAQPGRVPAHFGVVWAAAAVGARPPGHVLAAARRIRPRGRRVPHGQRRAPPRCTCSGSCRMWHRICMLHGVCTALRDDDTESPAIGCGWCVVDFKLPLQRLGLVNAATFTLKNETNQPAKAFDHR
jgi:hypothetical protein